MMIIRPRQHERSWAVEVEHGWLGGEAGELNTARAAKRWAMEWAGRWAGCPAPEIPGCIDSIDSALRPIVQCGGRNARSNANPSPAEYKKLIRKVDL